MIVLRHQQRTIYEGISRAVIPDARQLWWEEWMVHADGLLQDEDLIGIVHAALGRRCQRSQTVGRKSTPSEVVLRLLILKHIKNWSYETLEREVRANLVYREFTRIGGEKVPDAKTMVRLGQAVGPEVIRRIHDRVVQLARQEKVAVGRKMRVDTTVVETNIHYPTDSTLLADGVRVLTRTMIKIGRRVSTVNTRLRNRMCSVTHRLIEMGRVSRGGGEQAQVRRQQIYRKLMTTTRRVITEATRIIEQVKQGRGRKQRQVKRWVQQAQQVVQLTEQVLKQTRARIIQGDTHYPGKVLSIFETETEAIRKGKLAKPTEFGKLVKIQEAENQIITDYEVFQQRPADQQLLTPSIEKHKEVFERVPHLVAADAGFYSQENESKAKEAGVQKVAIPNKQTRSPARLAHQKQKWFRQAQRWRVGCEGRISVLKRRHGLFRSRYKGGQGMQRWVGLGIISDNLINISRAMAAK